MGNSSPESMDSHSEALTDAKASPQSFSSPDRLIIFARIPEAGRAKTRLIPSLGPEGAAQIHQSLMRRMFDIAKDDQFHEQSDVEIRYAGHLPEGQSLILEGGRFSSRPQADGDLGNKLDDAVTTAFQEGAKRVLVIGTDCPDIDVETLRRARTALQQQDVVLGPALDGGYYLIGMRSPQSMLFQQIDWSTERVLQQTRERCAAAGLSVQELHSLSDIDHPEDLVICRRIAEEMGSEFSEALPTAHAGRISIVIPTLNEEQNLVRSLRPLVGRDDIEVIVADGGSSDDTVACSREMGARVVVTQRGRGRQLNAGAAVASGEVLLFLHADTCLPDDFREQLWRVLNQGAIAGAFRLRIEGVGFGLRFVEWGANFRSRFRQMPYGDQAIFLRARDFFPMGGFRVWPLMEDYELCRRLRKRGRIRLASTAVSTSDRRWRKLGVIRTTLTNQCCIAAYCCGVSPETIARFYSRANVRRS